MFCNNHSIKASNSLFKSTTYIGRKLAKTNIRQVVAMRLQATLPMTRMLVLLFSSVRAAPIATRTPATKSSSDGYHDFDRPDTISITPRNRSEAATMASDNVGQETSVTLSIKASKSKKKEDNGQCNVPLKFWTSIQGSRQNKSKYNPGTKADSILHQANNAASAPSSHQQLPCRHSVPISSGSQTLSSLSHSTAGL